MAPPNQRPFRDYRGEQPYHPSYRRNYERRDDQWVSRDEDYHYGSRRDEVRRGGGGGYRVGHHRNSGSARYHRDDRNYHKENKVATVIFPSLICTSNSVSKCTSNLHLEPGLKM